MQAGHIVVGVAKHEASDARSAFVTSHNAVPQNVETMQQSASVTQFRFVTSDWQFGASPVPVAPPVAFATEPPVAEEPPLPTPPFPPTVPASCVTSPTDGVPAHAPAKPMITNVPTKKYFPLFRVFIVIPHVILTLQGVLRQSHPVRERCANSFGARCPQFSRRTNCDVPRFRDGFLLLRRGILALRGAIDPLHARALRDNCTPRTNAAQKDVTTSGHQDPPPQIHADCGGYRTGCE
jgi:hypothetical protein